MKTLSIYYKLIIAVSLVSLLPTIALGALAYYQISSAIRDHSLRLINLIAVETAYNLERAVQMRRTEIKAWSQLPQFLEALQEKGDPRKIGPLFNKLITAYSMYDLLLLVDPHRKLLAINNQDRRGNGLPTDAMLGNQLSDGPWFTAAMKQGFYVSDFRLSSLLTQVFERKGDSLTMSAPIYDDAGRVRGYLLAYVDWSYFQDILDTAQAAYAGDLAGSLFLLEPGVNRVIAHREQEMVGQIYPLRIDLKALVAQKPTGIFRVDWPERKTVGYALVRGDRELETPWLVCVEAADEVIYRQAAFLRLLFIVLSGLATVLIILLVYVISQRFTEPILQLAAGAQAITAGQLNVETPVRSADEIGVLATTFNQMSVALRQRDDELRGANQQLEEANRLKSQFLANVSHELRTPMNSIIGFTTLVIQRAGERLPDLQLKNLHRVRRNALNLLKLLNSILDLSKIEAGSMDVGVEKFSLKRLLEQCLQTIGPLLEGRPIRASLDAPAEDIVMVTDRPKVQQIVINLLGNAAKFTERGFIKAGFGPLDDSGLGERAAGVKGPWVGLWVSDSGIGIPAEHLEDIFTEFRQVDGSPSRKYGGTGLGLAISKKLANLLEGDILVESEPGVGSKFTVLLPVRHASTQPLMRGESTHEMPPGPAVEPREIAPAADAADGNGAQSR
jgi:signal transduction histidine kinase